MGILGVFFVCLLRLQLANKIIKKVTLKRSTLESDVQFYGKEEK